MFVRKKNTSARQLRAALVITNTHCNAAQARRYFASSNKKGNFVMTKYMQQNNSSVRSTSSFDTEIPAFFFWNPKARYRVHKGPSLDPALSHTNPAQTPKADSHKKILKLVANILQWF